MAGFDFSQISDEQLEATVNALMHDPIALRSTSVAQRQATIDEYNRRRAARGAKPAAAATPPAAPMAAAPVAPNVEANLEASAAPIAPDPVIGGRRRQVVTDDQILQGRFGPGGIPTEAPADFKVPADELDEYGERFRGAIARRIDAGVAARQAARAAGYQDPEQIAYNEATGVTYDRPAAGPMQGPSPMDPNDPSTWDAGYDDYVQRNTPAEPTNSVERVDRYFADKKRDPLQSREEFVGNLSQDFNRRRGEAQIAAEGMGANRTPEQLANRQARMDAEAKMAGSPRKVDAMLARMAERAGVSMEEAQAAWDAAVAANKIDVSDGLTPDEVFLGTKALRNKATTRQADGRRAQQDKIALRREVRYNPVAALSDDSGLNDWQKMVVADAMLRGGNRGPTPLGVDAVGGENALRMLQGINLGQGMQNNPLVAAQAEAAGIQAQAARDQARAPDEDILGNKYAPAGWLGYDEFTVEEQQQMYDDLIRRGYLPADAQRAVDRQADKRRATARADWGE